MEIVTNKEHNFFFAYNNSLRFKCILELANRRIVTPKKIILFNNKKLSIIIQFLYAQT